MNVNTFGIVCIVFSLIWALMSVASYRKARSEMSAAYAGIAQMWIAVGLASHVVVGALS